MSQVFRVGDDGPLTTGPITLPARRPVVNATSIKGKLTDTAAARRPEP